MRTLAQLTEHVASLRRRRPQILPFFCMVDRRRSLHRGVAETGSSGIAFLEARIPESSIVEQMGVHRAPLPVFARSAVATQAYEQLWEEVQQRLG
jgi:cellulose biosynthesis protein BcsQ